MSQDPLEFIAQQLETKSLAKQQAYHNLIDAHHQMEKEARKMVTKLNEVHKLDDKDVTLKVHRENEQEFHLKIAGDLLIFLLHTNIITFQPEHGINKSAYIQKDERRKYFGQIMVYNFMADSLKFKRLNDPGYLVSRFMINHEKHFMVEGEGQLSFMFSEISNQPVTNADISVFIQLCVMRSIESDLIAPPFLDIRPITLVQKIDRTNDLGAGQKIGFRMSYQDDQKKSK